MNSLASSKVTLILNLLSLKLLVPTTVSLLIKLSAVTCSDSTTVILDTSTLLDCNNLNALALTVILGLLSVVVIDFIDGIDVETVMFSYQVLVVMYM